MKTSTLLATVSTVVLALAAAVVVVAHEQAPAQLLLPRGQA